MAKSKKESSVKLDIKELSKDAKTPIVKIVEAKSVPKEFINKNHNNGIELSLTIAKKLKEAALELDNKDNKIIELSKDIVARDEIISGFKGKVVELQSAQNKLIQEIGAYRAKEAIELKKQKENIVGNLVYLYNSLGISKTKDELNKFQTTQLIELSKALEITIDKKSTSVREIRNVQSVKPVTVSDTQEKESLSSEQIAQSLFGNKFY